MNKEDLNGKIIRKDQGKQRWLIISNPGKLNSISKEMADSVCNELDVAERDEDIAVVLIRGEGENFSSGADLSKFESGNERQASEFRDSMNGIVLRMNSMSKPVIAVLHGYSMGGGLEIAESADIRISGNGAKIGQPEIKIGINAGAGGNVILPRLIGRGKALYMMLTGEILTAHQALDFGLIDLIYEDSQLFEQAQKIAEKISSMPKETISVCKRVLYSSEGLPVKEALNLEKDGFVKLFSSKETMERIQNFQRKTDKKKQ
ncbi:MAG: enoyl-CoA hydratase/isomerase family protein [Thermoplasmataceae archaeon]